MLDLIITAIKNKSVVSFTYDGYDRIVEPHTVGLTRTGEKALRCFQTHGKHGRPGHQWNLCSLSKIKNLSLTGDCFSSSRAGYKRGDKGMSRIYAQI